MSTSSVTRRYIRNSFAVLAMFLVGFSMISLATGFARDAQVSAIGSAVCGFVWLLLTVWEESRRQHDILADDMRPDPWFDALLDQDDELPWLIRGDSTAPLRTETVHTPPAAVDIFDGGKRAWWNPEIMGAPE